MRADLPQELEIEIARQLEYILPPPRSRVSFRRRTSTRNISNDPSLSILEESLEDDEDVFGSTGEIVSSAFRGDEIRLNEELEDAYDHFLDKLENLVGAISYIIKEHILVKIVLTMILHYFL